MLAGNPSRTAMGAALYRAAHQLVDRPPVFVDPLAVRIALADGARLEEELRRRSSPQASFLRAFVAVRSRYAEDCFEEAYRRGVRQYVVLGAGLDSYACRCALEGVRVVELDHPATQAFKRAQLSRAGLFPVPRALLAPVDFERETLREGLSRGLVDTSRPVFLAWLGVTPYLTEEAIFGTLRIVAEELARGSEIVFDFAEMKDGPASAERSSFLARARAVGEPFRSAFSPEALISRLRALGFDEVGMEGAPALNRRYFDGRQDGLHLRGGYIARARVGEGSLEAHDWRG